MWLAHSLFIFVVLSLFLSMVSSPPKRRPVRFYDFRSAQTFPKASLHPTIRKVQSSLLSRLTLTFGYLRR